MQSWCLMPPQTQKTRQCLVLICGRCPLNGASCPPILAQEDPRRQKPGQPTKEGQSGPSSCNWYKKARNNPTKEEQQEELTPTTKNNQKKDNPGHLLATGTKRPKSNLPVPYPTRRLLNHPGAALLLPFFFFPVLLLSCSSQPKHST